jgi:hypothetical protein
MNNAAGSKNDSQDRASISKQALEIQADYDLLMREVSLELEWFKHLIETVKELERQFLAAKSELQTLGARTALDYCYYETLWRYQMATPGTPLDSKLPRPKETDEGDIPPKPPYYFIFRDKRHR